jgi:hypothetical protein
MMDSGQQGGYGRGNNAPNAGFGGAPNAGMAPVAMNDSPSFTEDDIPF